MAARLQAAGEPGQIVVSGDTAELVAGFFELEPLGSLTLKGIGHPVPAFRVLQRSSARHRLEARPLTAFIPRPTHRPGWSSTGRRSRTGRDGLALVSGEPGIGKSRLLLEFSSELAAQGHTVTTIFCSRRGSLSPLQPFGEVMGEVPATPQEAAAWVEDQARRGPVLLVVEDAHWADPSTLEAVHVIARGNRARPGADERPPRDRRRSSRPAGRAADAGPAEHRRSASDARATARSGPAEAGRARARWCNARTACRSSSRSWHGGSPTDRRSSGSPCRRPFLR